MPVLEGKTRAQAECGGVSLDVQPQEIDVARNLKLIEWLKTELISTVSALFKAMLKTGEDSVLDALAQLIITCYLIGRRLGITFSRVDLKIENKLKANIERNHEIEKWYGDLSALSHYCRDNKKR